MTPLSWLFAGSILWLVFCFALAPLIGRKLERRRRICPRVSFTDHFDPDAPWRGERR